MSTASLLVVRKPSCSSSYATSTSSWRSLTWTPFDVVTTTSLFNLGFVTFALFLYCLEASSKKSRFWRLIKIVQLDGLMFLLSPTFYISTYLILFQTLNREWQNASPILVVRISIFDVHIILVVRVSIFDVPVLCMVRWFNGTSSSHQ